MDDQTGSIDLDMDLAPPGEFLSMELCSVLSSSDVPDAWELLHGDRLQEVHEPIDRAGRRS